MAPTEPLKPAKSAPPDPAKATHYVVQHMLDHHGPDKGLWPVVEAVDVPAGANERLAFDAEYPTRKVIRRQDVPRLLALNAIRPATEDEVEAGSVALASGVGMPVPAGDQMTITKANLQTHRDRIKELEADKAGNAEEIKRLRTRLQELEDPGKTKDKAGAKG